MFRSVVTADLALAGLARIAVLSSSGAEAVLRSRAVGIPKGCVANPGVAGPVVRTPGVGAPGVGVRAGTPANRGGPVNRRGRF
jgi:hypothetical protein